MTAEEKYRITKNERIGDIKDRLLRIVAFIDSRDVVEPMMDNYREVISSLAKQNEGGNTFEELLDSLIGELIIYVNLNSSKDEYERMLSDLRLEVELLKKENNSLMNDKELVSLRSIKNFFRIKEF